MLRADARRNRTLILACARELFASAVTPVTLEAVAQAAGVGIGTLYRHFPTREALVEAVYHDELDEVIQSTEGLLAQNPAAVALRAWLTRYARFMVTKRGLHRGGAPTVLATPQTRERITGALQTLMQAGVTDGTLRADVSPSDVVTNLLGIFLATATDADGAQADRLLTLLVDALHSQPATPDEKSSP